MQPHTPTTTKPYSMQKYQQIYLSASNKVLQFFTLHNLKKYIDYENKTKFQKQLMEQILKQLRQFLRKKVSREFDILMREDARDVGRGDAGNAGDAGDDKEGPGFSLEDKFRVFDEVFFRVGVMEDLLSREKDKTRLQVSPFESYDIQDQVLNQLQSELAKIYTQL